jgi:WD40 repeat protein
VDCRSLLADARFLMRDYQFPITLSALQVYHSGVVSMPECALRRQTTNYNIPCLISERDHDWQTKTMILEGHRNPVTSVAFSSDGSRIVSGSDGNTVRIWDAMSGVTLHTLKGHTGLVTSVAFSSDGLRIVSGSWDHTVRIWDAASGVTLHTLKGHTGSVLSVAFSFDGLRIASGSWDCTVRIWDAGTGAIQHVLQEYDYRNDIQSSLADSPSCKGLCRFVDSSSSLLTIRFCYQKMCECAGMKSAVPSDCIQMAGYSAEMEVVLGGGCAGCHISVGTMEEFLHPLDKK